MALIGYNGGLLGYGAGLAGSLQCCCDPGNCPPCCIRIDSGAFNGDGDLEWLQTVGGNSLKIIVVMPTKNSRIVCDGETIDFTWELLGDTEPEQDIGGFANFGPSWLHIENNGVNEIIGLGELAGVVEWTTQTGGYVRLQFISCFISTINNYLFEDYLAFIRYGTDNPDISGEVESGFCSTAFCCDNSVPCEPCCLVTPAPSSLGPLYYGTSVWWFDVSDSGNLLMVNIDKNKVCLDEDLTINAKIIPARILVDYKPGLQTIHTDWFRNSFTPPVGPFGAETEDSVDWGELVDDGVEYLLGLTFRCVYDPDTGEPVIPGDIQWAGDEMGVLISFTECNFTGCCPESPCACCFGEITALTGSITYLGHTEPFTVPAEAFECTYNFFDPIFPQFVVEGVTYRFRISATINCTTTTATLTFTFQLLDENENVLETYTYTETFPKGECDRICIDDATEGPHIVACAVG